MAVTSHQRAVCLVLAQRRRDGGDGHVAGGLGLTEATGSGRISRDIDLFHDSEEAVAVSYAADRRALEAAGMLVDGAHERRGFVEAVVRRGGDAVIVQWAADSAYRFFPLLPHDLFGLVLHPFDLATNKVLALVGRTEARDWVDTVSAHETIQPFGLLAWAACGKDPGFNPRSLLEHAARAGRYSRAEIESLEFEGPRPDAGDLARRWKGMVEEAREIVASLPAESAGTCVVDGEGRPFRGTPVEIRRAAAEGALRYREGSLGGVLPTVRPA